MAEMMDLIIATSNVHKVREFREMMKLVQHINIISLQEFPDYIQPEETGSSFAANALIKAESAALALGKWVLADDSGLVVPALQGEPGVNSRRYAGPLATDKQNNEKLLKKMLGLKNLERQAYYECALCLYAPTGRQRSVSSRCEGVILEALRGSKGFGYDPLFLKYGYDKSFGELEEGVKNRISHRRKAFDRLNLDVYDEIKPIARKVITKSGI